MRNYYIFAVALTVFCIALILNGFMIIGSPLEQQARQLDETRYTNLYQIAQAIQYYYSDNKKLPKNLSDLKNKSYYSNLITQDPQTKKSYDYKINSKLVYQLCTDFATDTTKGVVTPDDESSSYLSYLKQYAKDGKTAHKKGYDCLTFSLASYASYYNVTPTPGADYFVFTKPAYGEKLCLGSTYTVQWEADPAVKHVKLYIGVPYELQDQIDNYTLAGASYLTPGEKITKSDPDSRIKGSFTWTVGKLQKDSGEQVTTPPGDNYQIAVDTSGTGDEYKPYGSDEFSIVDCSQNPQASASAQTK